MAILAGFDANVEFSPTAVLAVILAAIRSDPRLANFPLPPREFRRAIPDMQGGGRAHFILDQLSLILVAPSSVRLRLHFAGCSIIGNSAIGAGFDRQSGNIDVTIPISLERGASESERVLRLATAPPRVDLTFIPSRTRVPWILARASIISAVMTEITAMVGAAIDIALPIRVDAAAPGLTPLTVADMQLRVFGGSDPSGQSLALFLAFSSNGIGNVSRSRADLPAGMDFALTISARAFRDVVLAPIFQQTFRVSTRAALPGDFGTASDVGIPLEQGPPETPDMPVQRSEVRIELFEAFLQSGGIRMRFRGRVHGDPDAFGADLVAAGMGHVRLFLEAGELRSEWIPEVVDAWHDYGWGWYLTGIFGPFLTMIFVEFATHALALTSGGRLIGSAIPDLRLPLPTTFPGLSITRLEVTPASLTLGGVAMLPSPVAARFSLSLSQATTEFGRERVDEGIYQSEGCPAGDYPYTAFKKGQMVSFDAVLAYEHAPVRYRWEISGISPTQLVEGNGHATVTITRTNPGPPPVIEPYVEVELGFTTSEDGARLVLTANPESGVFSISVHCIATDASGREASQFAHAQFETREIDFGMSSWDEDLRECIRGFSNADRLAEIGYVFFDNPLPGPDGRKALDLLSVVHLKELAVLATQRDKYALATMRNLAMRYGKELPLALARLKPPPFRVASQALAKLGKKPG
jgi:hypothetical protein